MGDREKSPAGSGLTHGFEFAEFTVEPIAGTISGPAGRVRVDPKVMDVLVLLAQRRGALVPREELLDEVWSGTIVSDDALSRCIYQLRRHFSQAGGSNVYKSLVETLPKRGYRLSCEASPVIIGQAGAGQTASASVQATTSFGAVGLVSLVLVVALAGAGWWATWRMDPRQASTTNAEAYGLYLSGNEYFGRTDRQIALPHAVELYRQAAELDPEFVSALIGLVRAHTDMYWTGIDRTAARLDEAESALDRLFAIDPVLPEARLARANFLAKGFNEFEDALVELDLAEKSIPRSAELFFLRAMAHRRLGNWDTAIDVLDRAIELDPRNIAYLRQQHINYLFLRDYDQAERVLDDILALFPDDGTAYVDKVVLALCRDGDTSLARRYQGAAPSEFYDEGLAYTYTNWLVAIYDRDYEKALRILDNSTEDPILDGDLRNASFAPNAMYYARTHKLAGNVEEAREEYQSVLNFAREQLGISAAPDARSAMGWYLALAEAQAGLGEYETARESAQRARRLATEAEDALMSSAVRLASVVRVMVPAGYNEEALLELEDYFRNEAGHWAVEGLRRDPRLEPLLNHPGFEELEQEFGR